MAMGVNRCFFCYSSFLFNCASFFPPIRPHIQLPAEVLSKNPILSLPFIGDIYLTNTLIALLLVDLILVGIILAVRNAIKRAETKDDLVPQGISGAIEAILEMIYNLTEQTAGSKWAKTIFPYFATITLVVLFANWMELIPGVDSIGLWHEASHGIEGFSELSITDGIKAMVKPQQRNMGTTLFVCEGCVHRSKLHSCAGIISVI